MNVETTATLVRVLRGAPAVLVQVSTDYVFDGAKGAAYDERDAPHPLSVYGRTKAEAEQIALRHPRAAVVRTSTLFGEGRMNFCDHLVERLRQGQPVEAFRDQVTSPTYAADLAEALARLGDALARSADGRWARVYHLANAGGCSRVAFAERVAELVGGSKTFIRAIAMADQRRPAPRPAYSALATVHAPQMIGRTLRPWDEALHAYLQARGWLS